MTPAKALIERVLKLEAEYVDTFNYSGVKELAESAPTLARMLQRVLELCERENKRQGRWVEYQKVLKELESIGNE